MKRAKKSAKAHYDLGRVQTERGDLDEAEKSFLAAVGAGEAGHGALEKCGADEKDAIATE